MLIQQKVVIPPLSQFSNLPQNCILTLWGIHFKKKQLHFKQVGPILGKKKTIVKQLGWATFALAKQLHFKQFGPILGKKKTIVKQLGWADFDRFWSIWPILADFGRFWVKKTTIVKQFFGPLLPLLNNFYGPIF